MKSYSLILLKYKILPSKPRVKLAPQKISETQKLLRLNFAQVKPPASATTSLRLDIFKWVSNRSVKILLKLFPFRVKYHKTMGQGSNTKASMKLSKNNLKQLQRVNHPDKNYTLEKFLSQSNKSEVEPIRSVRGEIKWVLRWRITLTLRRW